MTHYRISEYPVTDKPWGREILVEHNESYAFKEIQMIKGTRSSLQSHRKKLETIFVVSGKLELEIVPEDGESLFEIYSRGEAYTLPPGTKHRVKVLEDCCLFEVSTPELDDIIRHKDDFGRL